MNIEEIVIVAKKLMPFAVIEKSDIYGKPAVSCAVFRGSESNKTTTTVAMLNERGVESQLASTRNKLIAFLKVE